MKDRILSLQYWETLSYSNFRIFIHLTHYFYSIRKHNNEYHKQKKSI